MKKVFDVNIFGLKVPVYVKKNLLNSQDTYGLSDFTKMIIVIDSSLNQKMFTHTLAHEMIHFMFHRLNIEINPELEEQLCETAIIPLFENLQITLPTRLLSKVRDLFPAQA
jgi:Zn-dependent peptidase ImmA (M78 family)